MSTTNNMSDYKHTFHLVTSLNKGALLSEDQARKIAGTDLIDTAITENIHVLRTSVKQKATKGLRMWGQPLDSGYVQVTTRYV